MEQTPTSVKVVIQDNCHYPSPPRRITLEFKPTDPVVGVVQKIVEETQYPQDHFDIFVLPGNKTFMPESDKTFEQLGIAKMLLSLSRKPNSAVDLFPQRKEENKMPAVAEIPRPQVASQKQEVKNEEAPVKANECGICLSEDENLESLGCKHVFCKDCLARHLSTEFDEKRKSFLDVACPGLKCTQKFTDAMFRKFATPATLKNYESVWKTIPKNPEDPNLSLKDFCYTYNDKDMLVHAETGDKFHWVNQIHYDLLGDLIIPYVQDRMKKDFNMQEVFMPSNANPSHVVNNIFMTPDALTNPNKLMLLIQGSGAVRAGQWARALCINDSLEKGTILPYLQKAIAAGYGVIVFNPNLNKVPKDPAAARPKYEDFLIPGKPQPREVPMVRIPESESPPQHTINVWDKFAAKAPAKEIVIVAHSAGGSCTMSLLREREKQVLSRLKAIAFTDSVHSTMDHDPPAARKFLKAHAVNWVQSDDPLDTPQPNSEGVKCVSAGHPKHEYTSPCAIESVFKFLATKVSK